jgi:flagellar motor switch protein FliG
MQARAPVRAKDAEEAMTAIILAIRKLEEAGELALTLVEEAG